MNSAVQPKFSTAPAAPPAETQSPPCVPVPAANSSFSAASTLFQKSPHLAHSKILIISFIINVLWALLPFRAIFIYLRLMFSVTSRVNMHLTQKGTAGKIKTP